MPMMLTVDGDQIVEALEASGGVTSLVPMPIPAAGGFPGTTRLVTTGTLAVAGGGTLSDVGPFALVAGELPVLWAAPDDPLQASQWMVQALGGFTDYSAWIMRALGDPAGTVRVFLRNDSGFPVTWRYAVFAWIP